MKTTLQKELTVSEARDTVVITDREARTICTLVSGIKTQMDALQTVLESCGMSDWRSQSPRSLANFEFTIKRD
jgi:hypothetical protein